MSYTTYEAMPLDQMLARVQKHHPGDGCLLVEKAYRVCRERPHRDRCARAASRTSFTRCSVASILTDTDDRRADHRGGLSARHGGGLQGHHPGHHPARNSAQEVAQLVDGVTKLDKLDFTNREEAAGREPAQDDPGHEQGHPRGASSSWRTACTTCAPCASSPRKPGRRPSPTRRWTSTPPWRTAWA